LVRNSPEAVLSAGLVLSLVLTLSGCVRGTIEGNSNQTSNRWEAQQSDIRVFGTTPGVTPFIASVQLVGQSIAEVSAVTFIIAPKPNAVARPVNVTWNRSALSANGYLQNGSINLPVVGLYDGYQNQVSFQIQFADSSVQQLDTQIVTQPYTDPTGVYQDPLILKSAAPGNTLGFSFFILKSLLASPVIVDTDGAVRWVIPAPASSAVYFSNGQFFSGNDTTSAQLSLFQLDGTVALLPTALPQPLMQTFTHNMDPGSSSASVLAEFSGTDDLGSSVNDIVADISPLSNQTVLQTFDMADILSAYMRKNGDDPTAFVRPGIDWFHVNASKYDPSDDSVIVSSRENFLIKINYQTKDVVWILGDPTKYWYTFPSLRAKALTLDAGGDYPVGQHGVSITSDGYVMVFNDGLGSENQPSGEPAGITRTYSEVNAYSIDTTTMTAHQVWSFNYGGSIYSSVCGSVYEAPGKTYLIDFATADNYAQARLVGLDSNHNVAFDFEYASPSICSAAWNAIPISLDNMTIN
jgi:arylsulfate sulfotransferase